jgi:hypothetical protein
MTAGEPADRDAALEDEHERNTELLRTELPNYRLADRAYLRWLYDENPIGHAIRRQVDDDEGLRIAHYAMIPQRYRGPDGTVPAAFSLHAVVRTGTQRRGLFRQLGQEVIDAAQAAGWQFASGVCNEKSIGTVVKYLDWKTPGPLPVRLCIPVSLGRGTQSYAVDDAFRAGRLLDIAAGLDSFPVTTWTNSYTPEYLAWRLGCPHASYAVHVTDELVGISTTDKRFGVRAAVILKLLPRDGRGGLLSSDAIVGAACRFHRAAYAVYAGFNEHVRVRGFHPPRRLQPSPLHLILRSFTPDVDQDALGLDTFEFLDMDAY